MTISNRRTAACVIGLMLLMAIGCGSEKAADRPETYPVVGTVTLDGSPLEGAVVTLVTDSAGGRGATGKTDESGQFVLTTFEPGDGAISGTYQVKITQSELPEGVPEGDVEVDLENTAAAPPTEQNASNGASARVPDQYADPGRSGLTAEITEGENTLSFELSSQ
jgi:hypothetical protein